MSVYACLGNDAAAIRDAFLTRLQSKIEDMRIKVMILEFLTVAVETQPGLIELFLNLEVKDGSDGSKVSPHLGQSREMAPWEVGAGLCACVVAGSNSGSHPLAGIQPWGMELSPCGAGADRFPAAGSLLVSAPAAPGSHCLSARPVAGPAGQCHAGPQDQVSDSGGWVLVCEMG